MSLLCAATSTDQSAAQKNKAASGIAVAVILILAAVAGGFFWHRHKKAQARNGLRRAHCRLAPAADAAMPPQKARAYQDMERVTEMQ